MQSNNWIFAKLAANFRLGPEERRALRALKVSVHEFAADTNILQQGDIAEYSGILMTGMISRSRVSIEGDRQILSFHFPGDFYDAQSILIARQDHDIGTVTASTVGQVAHHDLLQITEEFPTIGLALWKASLLEAAIFREWMVNLGQRAAFGRVAHLICEIYLRRCAIGDMRDQTVPWLITQEKLGQATGLSLIHVNRMIQELKGKDLIRVGRQSLTVNDWDGLCAAGEFEASYLHLREEQTGAIALS